MYLFRDGTFDAAIWQLSEQDYPTLPQHFAPGEIVVDVGCHTGAVCDLAARRGATVVGYEANRENHVLAKFNLARHPSVTVHHAAIWRSDVDEPTELLFTPSVDRANTGGGSVLFAAEEDHWRARPGEGADPRPAEAPLSSHTVAAVPLDDVLVELGRVRFLKLDAEGAEFPILLTATRLDLVDAIAGEYHELSDADMALLVPSARVGPERYSAELLRHRLREAGFTTKFASHKHGRGFFSAERVTAAPGA
jgi:FkbM family methyltransferase